MRRIGREVQVGVQNLVGAQQGALLWLRLLDLDDHVGLGKLRGRINGQRCAGRLVLRVAQADVGASAALHQHLVAVAAQLMHAGAGEADAVLMVLDFLG